MLLAWSGAVDLEVGMLRVVASLQRVDTTRWESGAPKTQRSRRQIALTTLAVDALRAHRKRQLAERLAAGAAWRAGGDHDLVFCSEIGEALHPQILTRSYYRALLERAGLRRARFHDARHTAASLMLEAGVLLKVVSEMLGHTTISITADIYGHITDDMQRSAAGAMDALFRRQA